MYLKAGDEYADGEMALLADLLAMVDKEILRVQEKIKASKDPETDGLLDRGEYFVGIGVTAIQQYFSDTLTLTGIDKKTALELGPKHSKNYSIFQVINAAANYWKHSAEWYSESELRKDAQRTIQVVSEVSGTNYYMLYNSLHALLRSSDVTLCSLLPMLVLWRTAVDGERQRNA
ncbi:hypothetical protein [Lamprocystis purpurea]|uniref:hypothetical protein n=1 Tax=Lamprocystis purpurea TaxID=61598 RepID=UPI0012F85CBC|nr:hypothetical protein [Lamprocystis purpurea]MBV5347411.1 hypothetical protein [bacterium]